MGDRAAFGFKQERGDTLYLYGHWAGEGMMNRLAKALVVAKPRWDDEAYGTRIMISNMIDEHNSEYGWGLTINYVYSVEHSVPIVNWSDQTVSLFGYDWKTDKMEDEPKFTMSFQGFVDKFLK